MRIVVTGLRGFPGIQGGVETHCEELCPRMAALGGDITVTRRKPFIKESPPYTSYQGVKFKDLNAPRRSGFEAAVHTLRSVWYAYRTQADLVHIQAIGPCIAVPLAKLLGLKVVATHHGPDYDRRKWGRLARFILRAGECFAARWADEVIVISTVIQDILEKKYGRTNVHLIYNGVTRPPRITSTDQIRAWGLTPKRYILAVGRFVEEKNFDKLVTAFSRASLPTDFRLVIAGDADHESPYSKSLKAQAAKHGVVLTGMVKGQPLQELYAHTGLFVLPSSHEGLPITLLEAMSHQIPVLVSDIPANRAVGLPADCYFHYDEAGCVAALTQALGEKVNHGVAHTYDLTRYDWDHIAQQTYAVYLQTVQREKTTEQTCV